MQQIPREIVELHLIQIRDDSLFLMRRNGGADSLSRGAGADSPTDDMFHTLIKVNGDADDPESRNNASRPVQRNGRDGIPASL